MKRTIIAAAIILTCASALAQGTLNFANGGSGLQAKVTEAWNGAGLLGSAWSADLFWAPGVVANPSLLSALNEPAFFSTVPSQAGFFFGGARTIPGAAGATIITAQVRVWDTASGPTWNAAILNPSARLGESIMFQVTLADPNASPPQIPTTMTALNGFPFSVGGIPEPSTLALAGLGVVVFLRRCLTNR